METVFEKAKEYAAKCHAKVNQTYDGKPYTFHLNMGGNIVERFIHLIPDYHQDNIRAGFQCHNVIEDTGETFNNVKDATNETVADLAYALTNEKGKTRKDRANEKYYRGIRNTPGAMFLKLCDRIANLKYSIMTQSSMAKKYAQEHDGFKNSLKVSFLKWLFTTPSYSSFAWGIYILLSLILSSTSHHPLTFSYIILGIIALSWYKMKSYLDYSNQYKEVFDYMDDIVKAYNTPMKTIEYNQSIPVNERLDILKKAKGGTWYDGWKPYCCQRDVPCNARLERMDEMSFGFMCHHCGDMIGWDLTRLAESPLNKVPLCVQPNIVKKNSLRVDPNAKGDLLTDTITKTVSDIQDRLMAISDYCNLRGIEMINYDIKEYPINRLEGWAAEGLFLCEYLQKLTDPNLINK